jgi:hypothetical protein
MVSPFRAVVSRPRRREGFCGLALSLVSSRGVSLRDTPCFPSSGQSFREIRAFVYPRLEPSVHGPSVTLFVASFDRRYAPAFHAAF